MKIPIQTVTTAGFSMDYFCFGEGARTLVILPGLSVQGVTPFAKAVANQYKIFAKEYTVYVFERRKELPAEYSVSEMADDTAIAMQALGIKTADIYGTSQGGMMAMRLAATHPETVHKLALASTAADVPPALTRTVSEWCALAKKGDAAGLYLRFGKDIYPARLHTQFLPVLEMSAAAVSEAELKRFVILAKAVMTADMMDSLTNIHCPVLLISAEDDALFDPATVDKTVAAFTGSTDVQVYRYPAGYAHAVYDTATNCVNKVFEFLK